MKTKLIPKREFCHLSYLTAEHKVLSENQRVLDEKLDRIFALLSVMNSRQEIESRMRR